MLNRAWMKGVAAVLAAAGLIGVWMLRSSLDRPAQNAVALQVEADCDSAQRTCRARGDDLEFELRLGPPVQPMQSFEIALRSLRGRLVMDRGADARVEVQFQMRAMDMGINRYRLIADAGGVWRGRAMLPVCTAGRSDWIAQVDISAGGRRWQAELPFTVVRP